MHTSLISYKYNKGLLNLKKEITLIRNASPLSMHRITKKSTELEAQYFMEYLVHRLCLLIIIHLIEIVA